MKLQQGQVWKREGEYLRITRVDRLEVEYKSIIDPATRQGTHHHLTKKAFCRLLKGAALVEFPKVAPAPPALPEVVEPKKAVL